MTTGDDQPKPVILDDFVVKRGRVAGLGFELVCDCRLRCLESGAPSNGIDNFEPAGRNKPGAWISRNTLHRPLLECCAKGVVQSVLGKLEVAEQTDQSG
jgi:hypothetical protein